MRIDVRVVDGVHDVRFFFILLLLLLFLQRFFVLFVVFVVAVVVVDTIEECDVVSVTVAVGIRRLSASVVDVNDVRFFFLLCRSANIVSAE